MAEQPKGSVVSTEDVDFKQDPPKHEKTRAWPLVNPKSCPGAQLEFHITEILPDGEAFDDVHDDEDHVFYVLSGRARAHLGDETIAVAPGDAIHVPKGTVHGFKVEGGETFRFAVIFAPPRDIWG